MSVQSQINILTVAIKSPEKTVKENIMEKIISKEMNAADSMIWEEVNNKKMIMSEAKKWVGIIPLSTNHVRRFASNKIVDNIDDMNTS